MGYGAWRAQLFMQAHREEGPPEIVPCILLHLNIVGRNSAEILR